VVGRIRPIFFSMVIVPARYVPGMVIVPEPSTYTVVTRHSFFAFLLVFTAKRIRKIGP
jgi:hypothetical protein